MGPILSLVCSATYLAFWTIVVAAEYGFVCTYPYLANGKRGNESASAVHLICNKDYKMSGLAHSTCRSGEWVPPIASVAVCYKPGCSRINQRHVSNPQEGIAYLQCPKHKRPVGPAVVYCDGEDWYETIGACVRKRPESTIISGPSTKRPSAASPSVVADYTQGNKATYYNYTNIVNGFNFVIHMAKRKS